MGYAQFTPGPEAQPVGAQTRGIEHSKGEGGFWAKIVFQDADYPGRYAFIEQVRCIDPKTLAPKFFNTDHDIVNKVTKQLPTGERSLWNDYGGNPYNQAWKSGTGLASIQQGQVVNWAEEVNASASVPIGAVVWLRPGEEYTDQDSGFLRTDYTFAWSIIWAKITGGHKVSSTDSATDSLYQWKEVYRKRLPSGQNEWDIVPDGNQSEQGADPIVGPFKNPAQEINSATDLTTGTIVKLYRGNALAYNPDGTIYSQEWMFAKAGRAQPAAMCLITGVADSVTANGGATVPNSCGIVTNAPEIFSLGGTNNSVVTINKTGRYICHWRWASTNAGTHDYMSDSNYIEAANVILSLSGGAGTDASSALSGIGLVTTINSPLNALMFLVNDGEPNNSEMGVVTVSSLIGNTIQFFLQEVVYAGMTVDWTDQISFQARIEFLQDLA